MPLRIASLLVFAIATLASGVELRVATFNIGANLVVPSGGGSAYFDYGLGQPGSPDYESVRAILGRIDADVVALEEIHDVDITRGDVASLAGSLGYPYVFSPDTSTAFDPDLQVVFLSRFPFLATTYIKSPPGFKDMTRVMPVVKVDVPGTTRDPVLIGTHLKSASAASDLFQRAVEMRRLTGYLAASGPGAGDNFLVMGDFNLSDSDRTFTTQPGSGLPASFHLGSDITYPIDYHIDPLAYFGVSAVSRIIPRQLDNSTFTFKSKTSGSESTIDLFLVSPVIGARPLRTEIYNSALDVSNAGGLPKAGSPLAAGTTDAASDHKAMFGDFELDPAVPYQFTAAGQTVGETFESFPGTYDPYPWATTGGIWRNTDGGMSHLGGFRSYGPDVDPSLGILTGIPATMTGSFINQSTATIRALRISYTAEQWRCANGGSADILSAELLVNGISHPLPQLAFTASTSLTNGAIAGGISAPRSVTATGLSIPPGTPFQLKFAVTPGPGGGAAPADLWVNEFHYDNVGADQGEFIEIVAGPGYQGKYSETAVLLYNGADGKVYESFSLENDFSKTSTGNNFDILVAELGDKIQNGPDGIAIVNTVTRQVIQFISYEGSFTAADGIATGTTSTNIGKSQTTTEPIGVNALGLTGSGGVRTDFTWNKIAGAYSKGLPNTGQTLGSSVLPPQGISIDNLAVTFLSDSDGDGFSDADEIVFGTNPQDAGSYFATTLSRPAPGMMELSFPTVTGRSYTVERSTDLADWEDLSTYAGTGAGIAKDLAVVPGMPGQFYRVRVTLN